MAQDKINGFESEQDARNENRTEPGSFDFFNFSGMDVSDVGSVQDDLDLDSFLNFDELSEPENEPEPMPEPTAPQPIPEEDEERQARKARKEAAFAQLFGKPESEPEQPQPEPESEEPDEEPPYEEPDEELPYEEPDEELPYEEPFEKPEEPAYEKPPMEERPRKRGLFAKLSRPAKAEPQPEPADEQSVPEENAQEPSEDMPQPSESERPLPEAQTEEPLPPEAEDAAPSEPYAQEFSDGDEPEPERRKGLFARLLRSDDPVEDDAPIDDDEPMDEKPSFFRTLFSHGHAAAEESDGEEGDTAPAGGIISFFTRLTPEKEKFQALMQEKRAQEEKERKRPPRQTGSELVAPSDNDALAEQIGREARRSEELVYDSELDELDYIDEDDLPESRDYLPIRFRRYGKSGIGGGLMYAVFVISVSIILACFGWLCAADVLALSKDEVSAVVVVESYVPKDTDTLNEAGEPVDERGDVITCDVDQVATALKEGDIINFKFLFRLFAKLSHASAKIDPGTYDVSTKLDYRALITEMQTGSDSQEITKITFPEGYRMEQIFQLLAENDICDYDDLIDAAANHDYSYSWLDEEWYYEAEGDPTRLEGYLFPDTYEFYQGENAINVINRFLLRFHGLLTQDMYQQAENLGITLHDAVIVASLIEKEAGANDDRSNFSSVIYNRLDAGWKLQLDSTINYVQNTSTFNISYADLETDSPYNTYLYEGLPKGPICNAGLASLNAALNPNSTNYWFWYAYDGSTYFFTNSSDFDNFAYEHPYN